MPTKTVLSVGQCRPDTAAITHFLTSNFDVEVITADLPADTMQAMQAHKVDLVLINRKLDADYSDGMQILSQLQENPETADVPVMIVSNFPEWQTKAVDAGAVYGFGKAELNDSATVDRVRSALLM